MLIIYQLSQKISQRAQRDLHWENSPFKRSSSLKLSALKYLNALTNNTAIQLDSHGNPTIPRDWVESEVASCDHLGQPVSHHHVLVVVSIKDLKDKFITSVRILNKWETV